MHREQLGAIGAVSIAHDPQRGAQHVDSRLVDYAGLALHAARVAQCGAHQALVIAHLLRQLGGLEQRFAKARVAGLAFGLAAPDQEIGALGGRGTREPANSG